MGFSSISASSGDGGGRCPFASLSTGSGVPDQRMPPEQLRLTILGHVTNDINIYAGKVVREQGNSNERQVRKGLDLFSDADARVSSSGGGTLFSGIAASNLGMNVEVVTKCAAEDKSVFQNLFMSRHSLSIRAFFHRLTAHSLIFLSWANMQRSEGQVSPLERNDLLREQLSQAKLR